MMWCSAMIGLVVFLTACGGGGGGTNGDGAAAGDAAMAGGGDGGGTGVLSCEKDYGMNGRNCVTWSGLSASDFSSMKAGCNGGAAGTAGTGCGTAGAVGGCHYVMGSVIEDSWWFGGPWTVDLVKMTCAPLRR